jgi:hypothetical protein
LFYLFTYLLVYLLDYPTIFGATSDNYAASATHLSHCVKNIEPLLSIFNTTNRSLKVEVS